MQTICTKQEGKCGVQYVAHDPWKHPFSEIEQE